MQKKQSKAQHYWWFTPSYF